MTGARMANRSLSFLLSRRAGSICLVSRAKKRTNSPPETRIRLRGHHRPGAGHAQHVGAHMIDKDALGSTVRDPDGSARMAFVFFDRVKISRRRITSRSAGILGDVIARSGEQLLPLNNHSPRGIMRAP